MKKFLLLFVLSGLTTAQVVFSATESANPTTLFYTDFTEGTDIETNKNQWTVLPDGPYINSTNPSSSQFTCLSAGKQSSSYLKISPTTKLTSISAGTGYGFVATRNVDLAATPPRAIKIEFLATVVSGSSGSSPKFFFQIGSGFTNETLGYSAYPPKPADALVHSGFGVRYASSTTMTLYQNNGSTTMSSALTCSSYANMVWTMVINNSDEELTYTAPDGNTETVANDTYDLWIGTTKIGNDIPATTGSQTLNQFKFGEYNVNGRGSWTINWFSVKDILADGGGSVDEPSITLSSAAGTDNQTVTTGTNITNIEYTWGGTATGATVQWSDINGAMQNPPAGISVNSSANPIVISGTPTTTGIYTYTVNTTGGTNSATTEGSITVNTPACVTPDSKTVNAFITSICAGDPINITLTDPQTGVSYALYANEDINPLNITPTGSTTLTWVVNPTENTIYSVKSIASNGFCAVNIGSTPEIVVKIAASISKEPTASISYTIGDPIPAITVETIGGSNLIYTWYQSTDESNATPSDDIVMQSGSNSSFTPNILFEENNSYYFYCIISGNECGSNLISEVAEIIVSGPTYYWIGGTGSASTIFTNTANWSYELGGDDSVPSLTVDELAAGKFIFDGRNIGAGTTGNVTTRFTTVSIGKLELRNDADVTFSQSSSATVNLISQTDDALIIDATSTLSTAGSALTLNLYAGQVFGKISFGNGSSNGSILPTKENGLIFEDGSEFSYTFSSTGSISASPFAQGTTPVVLFKSGSTAKIIKGYDIFGGEGNTRVRFEKGSIFLMAMTTSSNGSVIFDGNMYGDIVYDAPIAFNSINGISGDDGIMCDNFTVKAGRTLTICEQGNSQIKGNFTVETGATVNFTLATTGSIGYYYFNGTAPQTITNLGTITINNNNRCGFIIDNPTGVSLSSDLVLSGKSTAPFSVSSNAIFDMSSYAITSLGTFSTEQNATLKTSAPLGIDGNIGNITGTINLNDSTNYVFYGNTTQETGSLIPDFANNFTLDNTTNVTLSKSLTVNGVLSMGYSNFILNDNNLTLVNPILGNLGINSHIVSNGLGYLLQSCPDSGSTIFPIGYDANNYNPITITNNASEAQTYSVKALASTLDNGLKAMWSIGGGNQPSTLSISWTSGDLKQNATITNNGLISIFNGNFWEKQAASILTNFNTRLENILLNNPANFYTIGDFLKFYRSKSDGLFSNANNWQLSSDNGQTWTDSPTGIPQETIADKVIISSGDVIRAEIGDYTIQNLVVEPEAILQTTTASVEVLGSIELHDDDEKMAGQLINTDFDQGTLVTDSIIKIYKYFNKGSWYHISMPFEVDKITDPAGNELTASVNGNTANYYLKYFDGAQRASSMQANVGSSGSNWKYFTNGYPYQTMQANTGYIFAVGSSREVVFVSKPNSASSENLADVAKIEEKEESTSLFVSEDERHSGWNFIGNPYTTAFNLNLISPQYVCYLYNYENKNYDTYFMTDYYLEPFRGFFIQATDKNLVFQPEVSNTLSLRSLDTKPVIEEVRLLLSSETYSDIFRVHLRDDATTGYDINKDGQKMFDTNTKVPQLYSDYGGGNLSILALPPKENESIIVPLSYFVPEAGKYTMSFANNESSANITKLILRDKTNNTEIDLLTNSYEFIATKKETINNKFELEIDMIAWNVPTHFSETNNDGIKIIATKNQLTLQGLTQQSQVSIYDITGRKAVHYQNINNNEAIKVNLKGMYIVSVKNNSQSATEKIIFR
jgi:hypothetical protein